MREKLKIIFNNTQMRSLLYLILGFLGIFILFLIYNPKFEHRRFNDIVDEENVKTLKDDYKDILKTFSTNGTYNYTIYYNDYIVSGYSIANTFYDDILVDEIKEYEEKVKPNILYEKIKDKEYIKEENEYKYDLDKITIVIENKKVKKIIYDDFIIEYGG